MKNRPSKEEILQEMKLHNEDEVGINNQWDYDEAEYHLLLSDKYRQLTLEDALSKLGVYSRFVMNFTGVTKGLRDYTEYLQHYHTNLRKGLMHAFAWESSPEGYMFWSDIQNKLTELNK